jgi:hypothetical protein
VSRDAVFSKIARRRHHVAIRTIAVSNPARAGSGKGASWSPPRLRVVPQSGTPAVERKITDLHSFPIGVRKPSVHRKNDRIQRPKCVFEHILMINHGV